MGTFCNSSLGGWVHIDPCKRKCWFLWLLEHCDSAEVHHWGLTAHEAQVHRQAIFSKTCIILQERVSGSRWGACWLNHRKLDLLESGHQTSQPGPGQCSVRS